jgi:hypothetical protein
MRGHSVALAVAWLAAGSSLAAQSEQPRTAEQFIEKARTVYSVEDAEPEADPCAAPTGNEIVVCARRDKVPDQRLPSPTDRARAADEMPPDSIPRAPYVLGLPECGVEVTCHRVGRAPPPIYIIDLKAIPEGLTAEEAALVSRASEPSSSEAASPGAAP